MYAATGRTNVKWGAPISNGGPGTTGPYVPDPWTAVTSYAHKGAVTEAKNQS